MAKTPRKAQDPTQAALSAIEEALQIAEEIPAGEAAARADGRESALPPQGAILDEPPGPRRRPGRRLERYAHTAANDDRHSVGQILQALHGRPPRMPYYVAAIASAWWVVMALVIGYSRSYQDIAQTSGLLDLFDLPYFWLFAATLVLPPLLFFAFAGMVRRTQEMRLVSRAMTEVTLRLAEPEGVSTDAIVSVSQAIRREVAALGDGIERAIARASELETMVRNEVSTLERAYDENELRVRALVDELQSERDAIVSHGTRLREAISGTHEAFSLDVEGVASRIDATLTEATDRINASLNESSTRLTDNFITQADTARTQVVGATEGVLEAFTSRGTEMADRMAQVGIEVANALESRAARLTEGMNASVEKITEGMNFSMEKLTEAIVTKGSEVHDLLVARLTATEENINRSGNEIADRIAAENAALSRNLTEGLQEFDNTVKVHGSGLVAQVTQSVDSLVQHSNTTLAALSDQTSAALTGLDDRIGSKIRETSEAIDSRIQRIEQTIDARTQHLNETLAGRTLELARTISDGSKVATEAVDKTVAGMGEYFGAKAKEIATTISERAEAVDQMLGKRALEMTENLDSRITRFEDQVSNRLVGITESIETRGVSLTESLVSRLNEASAAIVTKMDDVSKGLHDGAAEVERTLAQLGDQVTKTLVERTGETVRGFAEQTHQIAATHETLRENVVGSLDKLIEANRLFKQLLQGVTESLEPLENAMTRRVESLKGALENTVSSTRSSVEWIDNQMNDLRSIANGVLRDLSTVTQRFEGQGRYIASLAETLSETHGRIDQSLEERRQTIDGIVHLLVDRTAAIEENFGDRSEQIGERLAAFNRLLQEQLTAAEERAQEIARHIVDSTNQISQTIGKQHEVIRLGYSEERGRTASALKSTYEEAMQEMKQMFADLQERFTDTAREVREVSSEVQRALDQTRIEIKRGVLELPHETRENAEAMRRVVSDQLKALAELNEIVSRHAREMDVIEPNRAYRGDEALAVGGSTRYGRGESASVTEMPVRPRAAAPRGEPIEFRRAPRREPEAQRPALREAPARTRRETREEEENGRGWLTDLMSRVEERDDDSTPTIESLDSLSLDIARMIDHDTAVELWDRHQRGERGVFSRRLYTPEGQKTFEEIRRRYRKNDEFRETVDRYIDEFERLLEQVSRDDRGQVLSKTYLTSDTGKVYTLLAHAAARLN
ncbi:MAG: hypothetical protein IT539_00520 [Bradyrhizobiaceae bacterium]|nr:hypothetical protein [Bradyrhizobiaceae bacterium]